MPQCPDNVRHLIDHSRRYFLAILSSLLFKLRTWLKRWLYIRKTLNPD
jgi:hypothetical protein